MINWLKSQIDRIKAYRLKKAEEALKELKWRYQVFRSLLYENTRAVELITDLDLKLRESDSFWPGIHNEVKTLGEVTWDLIEKLNNLDYDRHTSLFNIHKKIEQKVRNLLENVPRQEEIPFCIKLDDLLPKHYHMAGGKAVSLARLRSTGKFNVPDGFSILVHGCRHFLESSGLSFRLLKILQPLIYLGKEVDNETEKAIFKEINKTPFPDDLEKAIYKVSEPFFAAEKGIAVRSSALGEDSLHHSFAGQFHTVLNVRDFDGLKSAIKEVIASNFSARSLAYRIGRGLRPLDFNMSVLCVEMINAQKAGVLFSVDPNDIEQKQMLITAAYGLGDLVVSGQSMVDVYRPLRNPDEKLYLEAPTISKKVKYLNLDPSGGVVEKEVEESMQNVPALSEKQVRDLVILGKEIEKYYGVPQDVEWAIDGEGTIWIIQSRPLVMDLKSQPKDIDKGENRSAIASGLVTSRGRAIGMVKKIKTSADLEALPEKPTVIVLHRSLVDAARVLNRVQGVLVDFGNPADHLSCVAREYNKPMLVGLVDVMDKLDDGQWVVVDGNSGKVYEAEKEEIESALKEIPEKKQEKILEPKDKKEKNHAMEELRELTVKLHLTDAYGPSFSIMECRSFHDIVRYVHEKAVLAVFEAGDELLEGTSGVVYKLKSDIPFFLHIIDLGGGIIKPTDRRRSITPEEISSRPFKALWKGISTPGLRWAGPPPLVGDVSSTVGRWMSDARSGRELGKPNYVIVARDYLNLNARMDFHFTMVDTVCGVDQRGNYVKFRFKGGGTTMTQRHRRAIAIGEILERADFFIDVKGDLVNAAFEYAPQELIEEKLVVIGRLLGFTRLIDAAMINDETPHLVADAFWNGDYQLKGVVEALEKKGLIG